MGERLNNELANLRTWNPIPLVSDPSSKETCPPLILSPKLTYYDKHIDGDLALKQVVLLPSLLKDLQKVSDDMESLITEQNIKFPPIHHHYDSFRSIGKGYNPKEPVVDANSVAGVYKLAISDCCISISSMFLFSYLPTWIAILEWQRVDGDRYPTALQEDYTLKVRLHDPDEPSLPPKSAKALTDEDTEILLRLARRFGFLATWEIFAFSDESEAVIKNMGNIQMYFRHEICASTGYSAPMHTPPISVDAITTPWTISPVDATPTVTINSRKASLRPSVFRGTQRRTSTKSIGTITVPSSKTQTAMSRTGISPEDFVQHVREFNHWYALYPDRE